MKSKLLKLLPILLVALYSGAALAQGHGEVTEGASNGMWQGLIGLGAGLAMGLGVFGAGRGQGQIAGSAMEGMARNPQAADGIRLSMLIALAFPESLVIFALIVAYKLAGILG